MFVSRVMRHIMSHVYTDRCLINLAFTAYTAHSLQFCGAARNSVQGSLVKRLISVAYEPAQRVLRFCGINALFADFNLAVFEGASDFDLRQNADENGDSVARQIVLAMRRET